MENVVPHQLNKITQFEDGSLKTTELEFIASSVPSIGYETFYIRKSQDQIDSNKPTREKIIEGDHYLITLEQGGVMQIKDKELRGKDPR